MFRQFLFTLSRLIANNFEQTEHLILLTFWWTTLKCRFMLELSENVLSPQTKQRWRFTSGQCFSRQWSSRESKSSKVRPHFRQRIKSTFTSVFLSSSSSTKTWNKNVFFYLQGKLFDVITENVINVITDNVINVITDNELSVVIKLFLIDKFKITL